MQFHNLVVGEGLIGQGETLDLHGLLLQSIANITFQVCNFSLCFRLLFCVVFMYTVFRMHYMSWLGDMFCFCLICEKINPMPLNEPLLLGCCIQVMSVPWNELLCHIILYNVLTFRP